MLHYAASNNQPDVQPGLLILSPYRVLPKNLGKTDVSEGVKDIVTECKFFQVKLPFAIN